MSIFYVLLFILGEKEEKVGKDCEIKVDEKQTSSLYSFRI